MMHRSTKLMMNKAAGDLNSISVLPPHARRSSTMSQAAQIRSLPQQQQSFSQSQGMSLSQSQLSQSSFDENLLSDQRFDSQDRDKSSKRISSLVSATASRDESQLQLARTSNSVMRRWGSSSVHDNSCQVGEELDNRIRQMESSLNRLGVIVDAVQSDIMQVNRAVKEVAIETEGVRQKIVHLDNSMGHLIQEEEGLKAYLEVNLKSVPEQILETEQNKLNEIIATISVLPKQIEAHLVKFQHEVCAIVTEKIEEMANGKKFVNNSYQGPVKSPKIKCYTSTHQSQKSQMPLFIPMPPPFSHTSTLKPKLIGSSHIAMLEQEEFPLPLKKKDSRVIIVSEGESDGVSCPRLKKETASHLIQEADKETLRILRRARKRKRRHNKCFILD